MKRALLINLPKTDLMVPPAAFGVLAGVCADNNVDYDFHDFTVTLHNNMTEDQWLELDNWLTGVIDNCTPDVLEKIDLLWPKEIFSNYDFICISVFSYWSMRIAMHLLNTPVRKKSYQIIIGGSAMDNNIDGYLSGKVKLGDFLLNNDYVNHVVYGDGETSFAQILNEDNQIVSTHYVDLDSYPLPNYKGIKFDDYTANAIFITGSRGCVRKCTYCDIANTWPVFRYRNAQLIVDEMVKHYYDLGVERFEFTDSLINGSVSNFYEFNCLLAEAKAKNSDLKNIEYVGQAITRPRRQMLPHHYEAMHYAGCKQMTIGIESFSERVREEMLKKFNNADIDYHIKQCARWGINNIWLMIVGYPTETLEDHIDNLQGIVHYAPYARTGVLEMIRWGTTLHYIDGTPLTRQHMIDRYQIYEPGSDSNIRPGSSYTWKSANNPDLTLQERIKRRLELHKLTTKHRIPQARALEDLLILDRMAETK